MKNVLEIIISSSYYNNNKVALVPTMPLAMALLRANNFKKGGKFPYNGFSSTCLEREARIYQKVLVKIELS